MNSARRADQGANGAGQRSRKKAARFWRTNQIKAAMKIYNLQVTKAELEKIIALAGEAADALDDRDAQRIQDTAQRLLDAGEFNACSVPR